MLDICRTCYAVQLLTRKVRVFITHTLYNFFLHAYITLLVLYRALLCNIVSNTQKDRDLLLIQQQMGQGPQLSPLQMGPF